MQRTPQMWAAPAGKCQKISDRLQTIDKQLGLQHASGMVENVKQKVSYITPVPGGVGPMTIAMLMNNVIKATEEQTRK